LGCLCLPHLILTCASQFQVKGGRKALIIGADGTKGTLFYEALMAGALPNFASIATAGKMAPCQSVTDPHCATAHMGHRFGSTFPGDFDDSSFVWVTSPGWCSVTTGVQTYKHMVSGNHLDQQVIFVNTSQLYPTIFARAKAAGLRTAASGAPKFLTGDVGNWGIIDYECGLNGPDGGPIDPGANFSCNLDFRAGQNPSDDGRDEKTTAFGALHIVDSEQCADIIMTHYDKIDEAGHQCDFSNNTFYVDAMKTVDSLVGSLLSAIDEAVKTRDEQWLVIVTSDHGGHNESHNIVFGDDEVVPFLVGIFAPSPIPLYDLSPPVKHFDAATTVMHWMGLKNKGLLLDGKVQALIPPSRAVSQRTSNGQRILPKHHRKRNRKSE
jgi:hypothetical protein